MARPVNPDSGYRVSIHRNGGKLYACTQPSIYDKEKKKKIYRYIHWGKVDENNKFIPGGRFIFSSIEERNKLIFPKDWNLEEIKKLSMENNSNDLNIEYQDENRLYGHIWLLDKIAEKIGVKEDLLNAFNNNTEKVNAILTIAYFNICENEDYNSIPSWQRITKTPYDEYLKPHTTTLLTQSITNQNRETFIHLRAARLEESELCSLDSTTKTSWYGTLPDVRWGKNKEHLPLPQTHEVVVYSLKSHMPVYYRSFPGNMPDSRTVNTILNDLKSENLTNIIIITDRGYETIKNIELYIQSNQKIITATKVGQTHIKEKIDSFGNFAYCPDDMIFNVEKRIYSQQYPLEYQIKNNDGTINHYKNLTLNIYFNPVYRSEELVDIDVAKHQQKSKLIKIKHDAEILKDDEILKKEFCFYNLKYDKEIRKLEDFTLNEDEINIAKRLAGFFAITTHLVKMNSDNVLMNYSLRDEQEKYFLMMKNTMNNDRQKNSSQLAKEGRLFILFVAQIIACWLSNKRKTELKKEFCSLDSIIQEMRPIRYVEHPNQKPFITPFVSKQIDICNALGFTIPDGCLPVSKPQKTEDGKTVRRKKGHLVVGS